MENCLYDNLTSCLVDYSSNIPRRFVAKSLSSTLVSISREKEMSWANLVKEKASVPIRPSQRLVVQQRAREAKIASDAKIADNRKLATTASDKSVDKRWMKYPNSGLIATKDGYFLDNERISKKYYEAIVTCKNEDDVEYVYHLCSQELGIRN